MNLFKIAAKFSTTKPLATIEEGVIYPLINFLTGEITQYPEKYAQKAKDMLKLQKMKKHMITADKIEEFLQDQKKADEMSLAVPKEVLFLGRSNVGKSSILNKLVSRKVGNVSNTPGTTKLLAFHEIYKGKAFLVDAPGYGYAEMNSAVKKKWIRLIKTYLKESTRLSRVYLLMNIEHGAKSTDLEYLEAINHYEHNIQMVLTKCDKLKHEQIYERTMAIGQLLKKYTLVSPLIHVVSSKENFGLDMLRYSVGNSLIDFHSKFDIQQFKLRDRLRGLEAGDKDDSKTLPPPNEMYKLLLKEGIKPN